MVAASVPVAISDPAFVVVIYSVIHCLSDPVADGVAIFDAEPHSIAVCVAVQDKLVVSYWVSNLNSNAEPESFGNASD